MLDVTHVTEICKKLHSITTMHTFSKLFYFKSKNTKSNKKHPSNIHWSHCWWKYLARKTHNTRDIIACNTRDVTYVLHSLQMYIAHHLSHKHASFWWILVSFCWQQMLCIAWNYISQLKVSIESGDSVLYWISWFLENKMSAFAGYLHWP